MFPRYPFTNPTVTCRNLRVMPLIELDIEDSSERADDISVSVAFQVTGKDM